MATFIIRRIIWTIPVILLVIFMTFVMMKQIGGNPFRKTEKNVPPAIQANLERKFNFDKPWYQQYAYYVKDVFTFDLGPSMSQRTRTVNDIIKDGFPKSLKLGILAFLWAVVLGIPLGVLAALKWPNDILLAENHEKLAGVLIELGAHGREVLVGIGVNIPAGDRVRRG